MEFSRRRLIIGTVGVAAAGCTTSTPDVSGSSTATTEVAETVTEPAVVEPTTTTEPARLLVDAPPYSGSFPFALGVASGDPAADSVVLWTRLISSHEQATPLTEGDLEVAVDVSFDDGFEDLVTSSIHVAPREFGHSVHAIAESLPSDTWFYYRFRIGEHTSPVGRTRTTPEPGSLGTAALRFGFSSCQNWESGEYGAHRHLAGEDLDLFVWLGDYIYEYGPGNAGDLPSVGQRQHNSSEVFTLDEYRGRYALYKSDPALQDHHGAHPWIVTWDDHEVDNNHAGTATEDGQAGEPFAARRAAAYQAWWEHMPVRVPPPQPQSDFVIYRSVEWGDLVALHMLDGRQFRSPQPTDGEAVSLPGLGNIGVRQLSDDARNPENSMLGQVQREWLESTVDASTAIWNALGNQVYMHGLNAFVGEVASINTDSWDGYFGERQELLESIGGPDRNLIVLSGDFHSSTAAEVRSDPFDLSGPIMATEFMAPAISSTFPEQLRAFAPLVLGLNPQICNFSPDNGYMTCEVTEATWTTRLHTLNDVTDAATAVSVAMEFTVMAGQAGVATIN